MQSNKVLAPYKSLGVTFIDESASQVYAHECPFCGKHNKFSVATVEGKEGLWHCWSCQTGGGGNLVKFLTLFHQKCLKSTTDYHELAKAKSVPQEVFSEGKVVRSVLTGEWLIPTFNLEGSVINLHRWDKEHNRLLGLPGVSCGLLGLDIFADDSTSELRPLWILEGHWDYLCGRYLSAGSGFDVLGVPGASSWKRDWNTFIQNRRTVCWIFDNDHPRETKDGVILQPGLNGMLRSAKIAASEILGDQYYIKWPDGLKDGYDFRDLMIDLSKTHRHRSGLIRAIKSYITDNLVLYEPDDSGDSSNNKSSYKDDEHSDESDGEETISPIKIDTWEELLAAIETEIMLTSSMKDSLAVMLSIVISTRLADDALWCYLVGPPGSGKSTLCLLFTTAKDFCVALDRVTGLHSGWKATKSQKAKRGDPSLIPHLNGKTWIVKDWTMFLTTAETVKNNVYGELRDIYDGETSNRYRNMESTSYRGVKFSLIAGVTDEIYYSNNSHLGERFLLIDITDRFHGSHMHVDQIRRIKYQSLLESFPSMQRNGSAEVVGAGVKLAVSRRAVLGFLQTLTTIMEENPPPKISDRAGRIITNLARIVAAIRGKVRRDAACLPPMKSRTEVGSRLVGQLQKLALCLAVVFGKDEVDDEVLRVIKRVARDTVKGFRLDIAEQLTKSQLSGMPGLDTVTIAGRVGLSTTVARRHLGELEELGLVCTLKATVPSTIKDRYTTIWALKQSWVKVLAAFIEH
ncbi:MAG: hypothetical protein QXT45_04820 [Candidatus Bilamarchaeaceae archaeon]